MEKKLKRAFWGYRKKDVQNMLESFELDLESIEKAYEREKARLIQENERLREDIEAAEAELRNYTRIRRQLESKLYTWFTEACKRVYETERQFDETIKGKTQVLQNQQNINYEIKSSTGKLLEQLKLIGGRGKHER